MPKGENAEWEGREIAMGSSNRGAALKRDKKTGLLRGEKKSSGERTFGESTRSHTALETNPKMPLGKKGVLRGMSSKRRTNRCFKGSRTNTCDSDDACVKPTITVTSKST